MKLARQLRTLSLVLHGEQGFLNPSSLQQRDRLPDGRCVADAQGCGLSFHVACTTLQERNDHA